VSWDEFAVAWSRAFDGYDLRHAPALRKRFMHTVYRLSGALAVKASATMLASLTCSLSVPLLAWRGGHWPAAAALMLLIGHLADAMTGASAIRSGRVTRLESFYQAVLDRFAELAWMAAMLLLGAHPGAVVCCAALVWAHEYLRARAGLAVVRRAAASTAGDRPLRVWFMVAALLAAAALSGIGPDLVAGVVTVIVVTWAALACVGLFQLFSIIRKALA
jgi:phosphatidylglycerophosphate synthase